MKVQVLLFSRLRDLAGTSEINLDLPEGTQITGLLERLYTRIPALRDWEKSLLLASGVEFVERDYVVKPNDQISIMPPVQGG